MKEIKVDFDYGSRQKKWLLVLLAVCLLARMVLLGAYPILDNTEARYAEISRQMFATDDWITPRLGDEGPFWGKPPLLFWLTALSFKFFGVHEFSARLVSFLSAVLMVVLTVGVGAVVWGTTFGFVSGIILLTTGLFFSLSGTVLLDPLMALLTTLSTASFLLVMVNQTKVKKQTCGYMFFVGLGLNLLAKGPIGCVLTLFPVFIWTTLYRRWKQVWTELPWMEGVFIILAIALPWHLLAEWRTPGFLEYYFIGEHWQRFTVKGWEGDLYGGAHYQPRGSIWILAIPALLPWLIVFTVNITNQWKERAKVRNWLENEMLVFLMLWFLAPLIIFTWSKNILMTYVLPSLPPFALMTAFGLGLLRQAIRNKKALSLCSVPVIMAVSSFVPLCFIIGSFTIIPGMAVKKSQKQLIAAFDAQRGGQEASLVYTRRMPFSARFYGKGRVKDLIYETPSKILDEVYDQDMDYFAIREDNTHKFPQEAFAATVEVGRFGSYQLRREKSDVPPG